MLIANLVIGMSANTSRLQKGMTRSQRLVQGLVRGLGALALVQGFSRLVRSNEEFNQAMTRSVAIMSGVNDKIRKDMKRTAQDVAFNTQFSAKQAAESYFFLASAGLSAEQSLAALPKVAEFAQAGNFDMALATDLLTDAQSALGLTVDNTAENMENMTRVSDVLAKANTQANATIQQFSEALTQKAGVALRNLGKDIEEGVAILAVFADQGLKGAEAGTALNIVFRDLEQSATKNAAAFARAGVAVFDAQGEMRNMADIVEDLEGSLAGASDEQRTLTLAALGFPAKSQAFIKALLGSSDQLREYEASLRDAGGTTKDIADNSLTPLQIAWNKLTAAGGILAETVLTPLIELFAEIIEPIADMLKAVADSAGGIENLQKDIKQLIQVMAPGIFIVKELAKAFAAISEGLLGANEPVEALGESVERTKTQIKEMSAELENALDPIVEVVDKTKDLIEKLKEERDVFGLSKKELDLRTGRINLANEAQLALIASINDEITALKLAEEQGKKNTERIKEQAEAAKNFRATFDRAFQGLKVGAVEGGSAAAASILTQMRRATLQVPSGRDTGRETVAKLGDIEAAIRITNKKLDALPQPAAF